MKIHCVIVTCLGLVLVAFCTAAFAHGANPKPEETTYWAGAASFTYRSDAAVAKDQPWLIPGALMGGEALPAQRGAALDYARANGQWLSDAGYRVGAVLAAHAFAGKAELELENLWLQTNPALWGGRAELAAGRMPTQTSPIAGWHATESPFSEAPLLAAAFWGGHFSDTGARAAYTFGPVKLGVEVWNGDNWPATSGDGSGDLYLQLNKQFGAWHLGGGGWFMAAQAAGRTDTRYSVGHSHGGQTIVNPAGDYRFDGDVDTTGVYASARVTTSIGEFRLHGEWQQQQSEGTLASASQSSDWRGAYDGAYAALSWHTPKHTLALRHERLVLENTFYSNVSSLFVDNAGLANDGFEPAKTVLSWLYHWQPELALRMEAVSDQSVNDQADLRFNIGLRWARQWRL